MIIYFIAAVVLIIVIFGILVSKTEYVSEDAAKKAGRKGEQAASQLIYEILDENDVLLTNVSISFDDKETELDNVIINNRGVFIVEVKNYTGRLIGNEDDYEWVKEKETSAGNSYQKSVKNPIKQVKRQIYIVSSYLKEYGIDVWVEGYAFFLKGNSPVESEYVLETQQDIDDAIHSGTNNRLTNTVKEKIINVMSLEI